ncbi:putative phospholipase [Yarrowia sp. C11]|nr:putative phospholipase [Yarrowia sp. C11]KAG5371247.1 putative phospholipase [Yarrowia sp. E02]
MATDDSEKPLLESVTVRKTHQRSLSGQLKAISAPMSPKQRFLSTFGLADDSTRVEVTSKEEVAVEETTTEEITAETEEEEKEEPKEEQEEVAEAETEASMTTKIISQEEPSARPWFFYDATIDLYDPLAELPAAQAQTVSNAQKATGSSTAQTAAVVESLRDTDELPPLKPPVFSALGYTGNLAPDMSWSAFAPADINALEKAYGMYSADKVPSANEDEYPVNQSEIHEEDDCKGTEDPETVVGINRLYIAKFSQEGHICMPLYWRTVGDICNVRRSTWFFRSTLGPVERSLERHLEEAFQTIKPWTSEYVEELEAAISNPEAECRFKHSFTYRVKDGAKDPPIDVSVVFSPCALFEGETEVTPKAHILLPSYFNLFGTAPSTALLATSLLKGRPLPGSHVTLQRFYDWAEYKKFKTLPDRPVDALDHEYAKIKQLIFVLHGIGQKLSEKVASFTFTFAINHFRVLVKEQLKSPRTKNCLPEDRHNEDSVAILPINWRRLVDFEELGSMHRDSGSSGYSLKDITVNSIPSVRGLIGDVLLDIPYYMSHHRPLLLHAAATEANRIYRIFCKHNPGFDGDDGHGNVHIIGHSLGSVIALDLLSFQPTQVAKEEFEDVETPDVTLDLKVPPLFQRKTHKIPHFCFNTSNLFLVGSPVGFFMLLHNANFKARSEENGPQYGCLAVKNLYNVINFSDPIAYLLNPTVDTDLAEHIKTANVPTEKNFPLEGEDESWIKFPVKFPFWSPSGTPSVEEKECDKGIRAVKDLSEGPKQPKDPKEAKDLEEFSATELKPSLNPRPRSDSSKSDRSVSSRLSGIFSSRPKSPLSPNARKTDHKKSPMATTSQNESPKEEVPIFTPTPVKPLNNSVEIGGSVIGEGNLTSSPPKSIPLQKRDFAREHQAEQQMRGLNDNGQIDWIVPLTGALENQYVSMITAHSNYWDNKDLARMCAIESCRETGPENTIEQFRVKMKPRAADPDEAVEE